MEPMDDANLLSQRPAAAGMRRYAALAVVLFGFAYGALVTDLVQPESEPLEGRHAASIAYPHQEKTSDQENESEVKEGQLLGQLTANITTSAGHSEARKTWGSLSNPLSSRTNASTHEGVMAMMTDEEYRQYVVKLCADAFPDRSKDVQDLDRAYRQEWERVAPHGYFYISIPFRAVLDEWGDPVKALKQRTISPNIVKAIGIWESLDWSRKHFVGELLFDQPIHLEHPCPGIYLEQGQSHYFRFSTLEPSSCFERFYFPDKYVPGPSISQFCSGV